MGVSLSDANGLVGYRFIIVLVSPWAVFDAVAPGVVIANFIIICTFCVQRLYQVDPANGQSVVHPAQYSARLPTQLLHLVKSCPGFHCTAPRLAWPFCIHNYPPRGGYALFSLFPSSWFIVVSDLLLSSPPGSRMI